MSETKVNETKPKRMVRRSVAIALGIVCIILVAVLSIVAFMSYSPTSSNSVASLQNQLNDLNATYNGYVSTHSHTDSDYNSLSTQNTNLQNQVNDFNSTVYDLNRVVNMEKTQYWEGGEEIYYNASSYHEWRSNPDYAGYLEVDVQSNATTTYVQVAYISYYGVHYDNQIVVGAGSTRTYFPILPALSVTTKVGNTNLSDGALIGVTIIYHY
jgi:hypothetical protein